MKYEFDREQIRKLLAAELIETAAVCEAVAEHMTLTLIDQGDGLRAVLADDKLVLADAVHRLKG